MNILRKFVILSFFSVAVIVGQTLEKNERQSNATAQSNSQSLTSQLPAGTIIQDGPVDPLEYIIGPGDVFSVSIWSAVPLMFQIPVTPEGTVVIPTVSEVRIAGMTLDSAKKNVLAEIRRKYITGTASFTLFFPRSFTVTVLGAVLNEGTVVVKSTQRIDAAVKLANDLRLFREQNIVSEKDPKNMADLQKKMNSASSRNIVIHRKNGSIVKADIAKYLASLNTLYNPLLLDGDVIVVAPRNIEKDYVGIYGAVTKEGNYEFVEGDSLSGLLRIAGGVTPMADLHNAILYRSSPDGKQEKMNIDLSLVSQKSAADIVLQRGDRLSVPSKAFLNQGGTVIVEGEVKTPGSFPILRDSTTLSQVIAMAGGFTKFASMNASKILRMKDVSQIESDSIKLKRGLASLEDQDYLKKEIDIRSIASQVNVDFSALFEKGEKTKDITLLDGDRIIISSKTNSVYVFGEVRNPGFVRVQNGKEKDIDFYIALAGGTTEHAEKDDIRIIKASTKQWLTPDETTIEEGDYLWIPKEPFRPFDYYLNVYSQLFGIVGTIVSLIIIVSR